MESENGWEKEGIVDLYVLGRVQRVSWADAEEWTDGEGTGLVSARKLFQGVCKYPHGYRDRYL